MTQRHPFRPPAVKNFSSRGFTLIELLVVMAILAILIALIFPSLGRVRERAKLTDCTSKLKTIASAIELYKTDNEGFYPTSGSNPASTNTFERPWPLQVSTYISGESNPAVPDIYLSGPYKCPALPRAVLNNADEGVYGLNEAVADPNAPVSAFRVRRASSFPLFCTVGGGSTAAGLIFSHAGPNDLAVDLGFSGTTDNSGPSPIHPNGAANFLFADGHVEARPVIDENDWPWNDPDIFNP